MRTMKLLLLSGALCALLAELLTAQQTGTAPEPSSTGPFILAATSDKAEAFARLGGADVPDEKDLKAGLLENDLAKELRIVPNVKLVGKPTQIGTEWEVKVELDQLIPFGESKVPLFHKGEKKAILRFYKAGLTLAAPPEGGFIARQGSPLTLELKNESGNNYERVHLRLRFRDLDVCQAQTDSFRQTEKNKAGATPVTTGQSAWWDVSRWFPGKAKGSTPDCQDESQWTSFAAPKSASVTLRLDPAEGWFRDPQSGFARASKRKGLLSLHFTTTDAGTTVIHEQGLPLEVSFEPSDSNMFRALLRVARFLLLGALLALSLRVVIPNYRRKKALKEQLMEVAKATRGISDQVPSLLRVLLRVERLTLDEIRRSRFVAFGSYPEVAQRAEQGLVTLKRKVELARRLDTAMSRKAILEQNNVSPTRLDLIEQHLSMACETLKRDQLLEQDWVFVQQMLGAADKYLAEPSLEEKDAFDASLAQRWKAIADFFGLEEQKLKVPEAWKNSETLKQLEACFPGKEGLPAKEDTDGSQWVKRIGALRADLQLSSLEVLRDFYFLAPSAPLAEGQWTQAVARLTILLATPAMENLRVARLLIRELAEGVDVNTLSGALGNNEAVIEWNPQSVAPNEKVRIRIRFRDEKLQTAAARRSIKCEWEFRDQYRPATWWDRRSRTRIGSPHVEDPCAVPIAPTVHQEQGWEIYHYFDSDVLRSHLTVKFYKAGRVLTREDQQPLEYSHTVAPQARAGTWKERRERLWQFLPEALQLFAALLVPIAALAVTQAGEGNIGRWWELVGVGFGSDTIRSILTGPASETTAGRTQ